MLPSKRPVMILMKGHPGSGKSTLARQLSKQLSCPLIDKDDARDCMQPYASCSTPDSGTTDAGSPSIDWNQLSYDIMFQVAASQLKLGLNVVVDCPLARVQLYERATALAGQHDARIAVVECACSSDAIWQQRLEQRGAEEAGTARGHKPMSRDQLLELLARYDKCWEWSTNGTVSIPCHIMVDTAKPSLAASDLAWDIISQLESKLGFAMTGH